MGGECRLRLACVGRQQENKGEWPRGPAPRRRGHVKRLTHQGDPARTESRRRRDRCGSLEVQMVRPVVTESIESESATHSTYRSACCAARHRRWRKRGASWTRAGRRCPSRGAARWPWRSTTCQGGGEEGEESGGLEDGGEKGGGRGWRLGFCSSLLVRAESSVLATSAGRGGGTLGPAARIDAG